MLSVLIVIAFLCWIAGFVVNGITLYAFMLIVPTIMFSIRKVGVHMSMGSIVGIEVFFIIVSTIMKVLFNNFSLIELVLTIIIRAVFLIVVLYDDTVYVYVNEERKRV